MVPYTPMPAGTIPCGSPASATMSHSRAPCSIGTYSSQPRSPTYEIREASTRSGPISIVSQVANGKPSCDTSALVRRAEDVARPRAPQPERGPARGEVEDLRGAVLGQVVAVPLQVGHAVRAARDHAEVLVAEPHHGEVRAEAAARREHRRVDDLAELHVHLPHRDLLHALERARADDVEDAERGEVEHRGAVAHRQVLGVDDRRPPARVPLGLAVVYLVRELLEQRRVRSVPVRPLPAGGLVEDRVERLLALVERRAPDRPRTTPTARPGARSRRSC